MKHAFLLLLIITCFHGFSFAQEASKRKQVDDLMILADSIFPINQERTFRILEKADSIARSINYSNGVLGANLYLASAKKYKPLESRKHLKDIEPLLKVASEEQKIDYYLYMGFSHSRLGDKTKALEHYLKADSIAEISGSQQHVARVNDYIASFYFNDEALEKALEYIRESLATYERSNLEYSALNARLNLGVIYEKLNQKDSALFYLNQCISESNKVYGKGNVFASYIYYEIAKVHFTNSDYPPFLKNLKNAQELLTGEAEKSIDAVLVNELYGDYYLKIGNTEKGLEFYQKAYSIADEGQFYESQLILSKKISEYFLAKNPIALTYFKNYIDLKDSIETKEKEVLKEQLVVQYEVREKDKQNDLLKQDIRIKEEEISRRNIILVAAILLSLFAILIVFLLYKRKQQKAKFQYLEVEQKLLRTQMNPHFIFNSLNSIQNYLLNNETEKSVIYLSKFAKLIRGILESSREEFIELDDEVELMKIYLEYQKMQSDRLFDYSVECDESLLEEGIKLPPLLIQPFIENAVKHAFSKSDENNKIALSYTLSGDNLLVTIKDNGKGIDNNVRVNNAHQSYAIQITKERIQNINAIFKRKVAFDISSEKGTKVTFSIPQS
ncbi:MAG: histidine kinase [Flavobacteriales bacterium]|nr:histidine kinase [Flavobacteriales bacterium]